MSTEELFQEAAELGQQQRNVTKQVEEDDGIEESPEETSQGVKTDFWFKSVPETAPDTNEKEEAERSRKKHRVIVPKIQTFPRVGSMVVDDSEYYVPVPPPPPPSGLFALFETLRIGHLYQQLLASLQEEIMQSFGPADIDLCLREAIRWNNLDALKLALQSPLAFPLASLSGPPSPFQLALELEETRAVELVMEYFHLSEEQLGQVEKLALKMGQRGLQLIVMQAYEELKIESWATEGGNSRSSQ